MNANRAPKRRAAPLDRSAVMRRVKSRNTEPELRLRRLLRGLGHVGYRLHRDDLPGAPDIAFIARRRALFVHGCFWHGHDCPRGARLPVANRDYWRAKIARNRLRDAATLEALAERGWRALIVWECALRDTAALTAEVERFLAPDADQGAPL